MDNRRLRNRSNQRKHDRYDNRNSSSPYYSENRRKQLSNSLLVPRDKPNYNKNHSNEFDSDQELYSTNGHNNQTENLILQPIQKMNKI